MVSYVFFTFILLLQAQGIGALLFQFLPFFLIITLYYFLILKPQRQRQMETQQLLDGLKVGDRVVTSGGMLGLITLVREDSPRTVQLRICESPAVRIDVLRSSIAGLQSAPEDKK